MKYYVYAIKSVNKNYIYVGLTNNLKRRLAQHNSGKEKTTKPYRPFKIIHIEQHKDKNSARKGEKFLKSGCGKERLRTILTSNARVAERQTH